MGSVHSLPTPAVEAPPGAPYTMAEAMVMLGCEEGAVVARIDRGELAALKFGRGWVFPRGAFHASLDKLAEAEAARRRAEHDARGKASSAIKQAKKPADRGRRPPLLPALP